MTSSSRHDEAYVWVWLPDESEPVVAGRIVRNGESLIFNYGRSYLALEGAIPLHLPELPLRSGAIPPGEGLRMAGCLRDASPDGWGRRVVLNRMTGQTGGNADVDSIDELTYVLESGSDRIGALDFQLSPDEWVPREPGQATLDELMASAEKLERGAALHPDRDRALIYGSSIGGARPKALIEDVERKLIAKFSSSSDPYNVIKAEFIAMRLAAEAGLEVAPVSLARVTGKDVLLVERFDREKTGGHWQRRIMVSALTLFGLDEMMAHYASYAELAEIIRHRFARPKETLHELFGRLVFNVLCGNTDDHARNHAAFWDGGQLSLTPAYDICPQGRTGNEAGQAMFITDKSRRSTLATCLEAAPNFLLDEDAARGIIGDMLESVRSGWDAACDAANLPEDERNIHWGRMFLNPFIFEGSRGFSPRA